MEDERIRRLEAWISAYGDNDRDAMVESLAENAVWHVGGTHRLSGDYRGRDEILGYFDAVRRETADALRFDDGGRITEFWAHATDQAEIDEFWSTGKEAER